MKITKEMIQYQIDYINRSTLLDLKAYTSCGAWKVSYDNNRRDMNSGMTLKECYLFLRGMINLLDVI